MRSIRSDGKKKQRGSCLIVGVVILMQAVGPPVGGSQELAPPKLDEELAEQEKIFRSRGAEVPRGYVINRGLSDYAEVLPTGFCDALGKLGSSDGWLDIGAGSGQAILDYYAPKDDPPQANKCAGAGGKARAIAMSIEDRRTDK